ncbi:uncharacterized protein LOC128760180 isoform X2 [Synchiropus splendidus]|uniref:uncharacterized protein LOC128760180 isoform X2 n=1 Tax=Synchiropus splendidus TaxID=270530 RepID=UPI00237DF77A|nr:uncharacterized protein LOC128760180 isoform X2 [Synchiropus splendidus]
MKKGPRNFLSRKNQSLFDTGTKMKDMDVVEVFLGSPPIVESGTASVRARPTVKHHSSTNDSFQGFAVPTPTVPVLPSVNGPKTNGSVVSERMSNGSSIFNFEEDEIFVPPPPSVAPPPPPGTFILPPPDFMGELSSAELAALQPPSMPAPILARSMDEDLSNLKPPPMAPPKPPSTCSSGSVSSLPRVSPLPVKVPEHPKFAPPQPPTERHSKSFKTPPPKPIRNSSIMNIELPPDIPAPPPPVQTPTLSTFNPQNTAKTFSAPKTADPGGLDATRPKQRLLLEDSGSLNSQVDGNPPAVSSPVKPALNDGKNLKESLQNVTPPPHTPPPDPVKEASTVIVSTPPVINKPHQSKEITSAHLLKGTTSNTTLAPSNDSVLSGKYSPILDKKLRDLKSTETHGPREGGAASPLALLKAAKEREKHRATHSHDHDIKTDRLKAAIAPVDSSASSFIGSPRSSSSSSLTSLDAPQSTREAEVQLPNQTSNVPSSSQVKNQAPEANVMRTPAGPQSGVAQNHVVEQGRTTPQPSQPEVKQDVSMPLLPPPPEFEDFDDIMEPPPSIRPPDPPVKKAPVVHSAPVPPAPSPPPLLVIPAPPKPAPQVAKPKPQALTKAALVPNKLPTNLSPSQATLLSILQKKMLEMDQKMTPVKEPDDSDDWGNPLSDEDDKIPAVSTAVPKNTSNRAATLDMGELQGRVARKSEESLPKKKSRGSQSTHQYGMTFTVRPGTKQPITLVRKGEP